MMFSSAKHRAEMLFLPHLISQLFFRLNGVVLFHFGRLRVNMPEVTHSAKR